MRYSKTSHTNHLYRGIPSLYRLGFYITEIKNAVSSVFLENKCTTSINEPDEFTPVNDRLKEVLPVHKQNTVQCMPAVTLKLWPDSVLRPGILSRLIPRLHII